SGNLLNVDGVEVPMEEWMPGENIRMQVFIDKNLVEVFVNGGRYCISRQVHREHIGGERVALTSLGGTARLVELQAWELKGINEK
ncbi:MAG: GH32 C-terminal domain-containing protein, partial [Cyclobacteriaceae bacterium]